MPAIDMWPEAQERAIKSAMADYLQDREFTMRDAIVAAVKQAVTEWLDKNVDPEALNLNPDA